MLERGRRVMSRVALRRPPCEVCSWGAAHTRYLGQDARWYAQDPGSGAAEHRFCDKHVPPEGSLSLDLTGDRDIEWSFVAACAGRYAGPGTRVLDFGAGSGSLSYAAASTGASVLAIDLMPRKFPLSYPSIEFRQVNLFDLGEETDMFDLIMNCSTIEHVGLEGRYGSPDQPDGDLTAMRKLATMLKPGGHMALVLPVGVDAVFAPYHRVYGEERLPRLLEGYRVIEERYMRKDVRNTYFECSRDEALRDEASPRYYALGLLVLQT